MKTKFRVLEFIKFYISQNAYPPTRREICEGVGLKSLSTVNFHLVSLEREGVIEVKDHTARAITIAEN